MIDFSSAEEGRAVRRVDGSYRYEYNLKDNLYGALPDHQSGGSERSPEQTSSIE